MAYFHNNLGSVGFSLAPGFSPVLGGRERRSRFNGFSKTGKAAEAAGTVGCRWITGLKPGANEIRVIARRENL